MRLRSLTTSPSLTGLTCHGDVRRTSCSRGYRDIARWPIVDPAGNARSYFLGGARVTAHPGAEWTWTGSGRAKVACRATATVRPAPPTQTMRGPDRPQGVAPRATEARSAYQ